MPIYERCMATTPKLTTPMLTMRLLILEETLMKQRTLSYLLNPVFESLFNNPRKF